MIEFVQKGGPMMWLLGLSSIWAAAIFFDRLFHYRRASINVPEFLAGMANLIRRGNFSEAANQCGAAANPVGRVVYAALVRHEASRDELRQIVREAGQLEMPKLENKLAILSTIAFVSPVIGLLGTAVGLLQVFHELAARGGYATAAEMAAGIYQSLLTTVGGLGIAMVAYIMYGYLSAILSTLMHDMERAGIEIVHLISDRPGTSPLPAGAGATPAKEA